MNVGIYGTLVTASLVLLLGNRLVGWVPLLRSYTIPEPVAGGLLVAIVLLILRMTSHIEVRFDTALQTPLMLAFFATIGLNANLASLKSGGPLLLRFLGLVIGLLILQNAVGIALTYVLGIDPLYGLLVGSITLPADMAPVRHGARCSPSTTGFSPRRKRLSPARRSAS